MDDWIPQLDCGVDVRGLALTPEEGFVLSRLDGRTPVKSLPALTGLTPERLRAILDKLMEEGAILRRPGADEPAGENAGDDEEPRPEDETPGKLATFRHLFETKLHALAPDERAQRAAVAGEPELSAFCFDPLPAVIKAVLDNPRAGLAHARLAARHHLNPAGLEMLAGRPGLAADTGVRWLLVRNPQLTAPLFRRLLGSRRLRESYKIAVDRDVPENNRRAARELLRSRFASGSAEERVELILSTEGRALALLAGTAIDGKTTALLCGRNYNSPFLIEKLARWGGAPPPLLAHLLKQETLRRAPYLRAILLRHPNAPNRRKPEP